MNQPLLTKRLALFLFAIALFMSLWVLFRELKVPLITVAFCDVGQGNGTYIRLKHTADILIDTGPDNGGMLTCLGKYMSLYDRTIEMIIISHPQKDHNGALKKIMERYKVRSVLYSQSFKTDPRLNLVPDKKRSANVHFIRNGQSIFFGTVASIYFLTSDNNLIQNDPNENSLMVVFKTPQRQFLFPGDISSSVLSHVSINDRSSGFVMQVPHHGSGNGLSDAVLKHLRPQTAVISVGKNNPYGHPAERTLQILRRHNIPIRRTDTEGDIVFTE